MKKIINLVLCLVVAMLLLPCDAKVTNNGFSSVIKKSGIDVQSIAVSFRDMETGKVTYCINDKMLMNPASIQKILTLPAAVDTLGQDYKFKTDVYSRGKDEIVIKLGADPYLTSRDLKHQLDFVSRTTKRVYIDDTILDNNIWGEGWQWDDEMNPLMPKFGSYNLDGNIIRLMIMPNDSSPEAIIVNPSSYPIVFFNEITTSNVTAIKSERNNSEYTNTVHLSGTVSAPTPVVITIDNLKRYFDYQLTKILEGRKAYIKEGYQYSNVRKTDVLKHSVEHSVTMAVDDVLKNSNNMVAETVFKLAGGKYSKIQSGSAEDGIKMFNAYCEKVGIDNSNIKIVDGSGVSKNNLVSADFMTEYLWKLKDNEVLKSLPHPGEGTLNLRLLPLKDSVSAKTGTLANVSALSGYLTSKKGNEYSFCIIINDMKLSPSDKKILEDYLIKEAYIRL